ncbi:MAG: VPS10 domain-containing protein, partial [Longimicrobiales bacterium]
MQLERAAAAAIIVLAGLARVTPMLAQRPTPTQARLFASFTYRNMGPFRMGARTSDVAVPDAPAKDHLYTFYVGYWTGGLWKTTNNGTTFEPVFDGQSKLAIGDVALAPANANIVWVGTGDAFVSRSSYAGDGVYKSLDAGKTWKNMGLRDSHHIARIVIHPTNPDIVYVAAVGALYSENEGRGVYRTTNGGATWDKVLYINEKIGIIDLVMNPHHPDILYAAAYDKRRLPWQMVNGGPESGIYKTTNGGTNWTRLAGGLPTGRIGRIGIDVYAKNPDIVYAVIENQNPRSVELASGRGSGAAAAAP